MLLDWLVPLTFGVLVVMNIQYMHKAAGSLHLMPAPEKSIILEKALQLAQKERRDTILLTGRIIPRELVLNMFVESGFAIADEWAILLPEYKPDLQRAAFEYLVAVSLSPTRNLNTVRQAFHMAMSYIEGLEDSTTKADACAVLFLAAGSKILGPRILKFVYEQQVEHSDICTALVKRAKLPESFLAFERNVLYDIKMKTPVLINIGLYRIAYPLIVLSEARFGYALYSSLFNEIVYYAVAADGRPEFCPQGRLRASACQSFITGVASLNDIFNVFMEQKLTEIEDALVFVWRGLDNPHEWG
jgi:hypothetical protein